MGNVTGTLNVLMATREAKVRRVVFASSSSVYGESEQLPQRSKKTIQKAVRYYLKKIKERGSVFKEDIQPHTTAGKDAGYLSIWRNDKIYRRTFDP